MEVFHHRNEGSLPHAEGENLTHFHPQSFPEVLAELNHIRSTLRKSAQPDNHLVVVSYAKDHCVPSRLALSHASLISLLRSKGTCTHLENLFLLHGKNKSFTASLEKYIREQINPGV